MIDKLKSMGPNNGPAQVTDRTTWCSKQKYESKTLEVLQNLKKKNGTTLTSVCIQVNDVVAAGQELDEEMMSKLSNMKVSSGKIPILKIVV